MFCLLISPVSLGRLLADCSKVVILLLFVHCECFLPLYVCVWRGGADFVIPFLSVHFCFEIILQRKRELAALL